MEGLRHGYHGSDGRCRRGGISMDAAGKTYDVPAENAGGPRRRGDQVLVRRQRGFTTVNQQIRN
jgi:hypothetical protein